MRRLLVLLVIVPAILSGQPVAAGTRVRLTHLLAGELRREGVVKTPGADSALVEFHPQNGAWGYATNSVSWSRLEVWDGARRRTAEGAGLGLLVGAVAGAAVGFAAVSDQGHYAPEVGLAGGALLGSLGGAVVGARIGWRLRADRWRPIEMVTNRH